MKNRILNENQPKIHFENCNKKKKTQFQKFLVNLFKLIDCMLKAQPSYN